MTDLGKKVMNGIVSDTPKPITSTPASTPAMKPVPGIMVPKKVAMPADKVIDIPAFLYTKRRDRLAREYADRQRRLYEQLNQSFWRRTSLRLKSAWRKVLLFFFEEA